MRIVREIIAAVKNVSDAVVALALREQNFGRQAFGLDIVGNNSNMLPSAYPAIPSLKEMFDGIFYAAVPKNRRTRERRAIRRFSSHRVLRYCTPKKNIAVCLNCGHYHEIHTVCGNCYSKVQEATKEFYKNNPDVTSKYAQ